MMHYRFGAGLVAVCLLVAGHPGCSSSGPTAACKTDEDCPGGVCLEGECVACRTAEDCPQGFECTGTQCVETCTSEAACSGHGTCDDASGTIVCTCDTGYAGDRCGACDTGYTDYGDGECRPEDPCARDTTCAAANRICDNQAGQAACGDCLAGFHEEGGDCVPDQSCQPDSCGGHGTCDDSSGAAICTCDTGYTGSACGQCAPGFRDYGNGQCLPADPCAQDVACAAENRRCLNQQGVPACGDCLAGYHEENGACVLDQVCLPTSCSGHGACDDSAGVVCTCDAGYTGTYCEACEGGLVHWPPDSGTCVDDPCDPDPCTGENVLPGSCIQVDETEFACGCEEGFEWRQGACGSPCTDQDGDGYGDGPGCLGPDCDDEHASVHQDAPEVCDGLDNDCNGETDEGGAAELCMPLPDHVATGSCTPSGCAVAGCEPGWSDANGIWEDGCEAQADAVPNTCAEALAVTPVRDVGERIEVTDALVPRGDEDWYLVTGVDESSQDEEIDECDDFDLQVRLLSAPEGVVFDVYEEGCQTLHCNRETEFSSTAAFIDLSDPDAPLGQCPCRIDNQEGFNICSSENKVFLVRVFQLAGFPYSDAPYVLEITNGM